MDTADNTPSKQLGFQREANPGRELYQEYKGTTYARHPIATPLADIGQDLIEFIKLYAMPSYKKGDVLCIATKLYSVCSKNVVHRSTVKVSWLANFIVRFVTKWPNDVGYANPPKMQVAINIVGYPRMILAIVIGAILKFFGKPGYFYRIAGHQINAIDGFIPHATPPFNEYAFLPPADGNAVCDDIERALKVPVILLDGNNIENNVMGMSRLAKKMFTKEDFMQIVFGNPQGQDDEGVVTPMLLVRRI